MRPEAGTGRKTWKKRKVNAMDWKFAPETEIVCYCRTVSKGAILEAIGQGARSLKEVMEKTGAGKGRDCALLNPRKTCCHVDILRILELYAPQGEPPKENCG